MNLIKSHRATYVAAFLLGALIALLVATPARSAESTALDRVAAPAVRAETPSSTN